MVIGIILPFSPFGGHLGLEPLGAWYFAWLALIIVSYIAVVQIVKTWYIRRYRGWL
jgi:Mg2+-importing ATPase